MYTINSIIQTLSHSFAHTLQLHIYMAHFPFAPLAGSPCSPCWFPLLPFVPLSTYLAPSSCDRNRPPPSQVACKLTLFAPPFTQLSHPFQLPRNPNCPAPNNDDLGIIPLLLYGTIMWPQRNPNGRGEGRFTLLFSFNVSKILSIFAPWRN